MKYKKYAAYIGIPVAIILILILYFSFQTVYRTSDAYTNDPDNWIEDSMENGVMINVAEATEGRSYYDGTLQQHNDGRIKSAFNIVGWINDTSFEDFAYYGDSIVAHIGPNIIPKNGVMDFFALMKIEDDKPYFYIFVDDDLISKYPKLNIYWGNETQYSAELKFQELRKGVYYAKMEDDIDRFQIFPGTVSQHFSGIYVTDATKEALFANEITDNIVIKIL
jgi:hypothetical protein